MAAPQISPAILSAVAIPGQTVVLFASIGIKDTDGDQVAATISAGDGSLIEAAAPLPSGWQAISQGLPATIYYASPLMSAAQLQSDLRSMGFTAKGIGEPVLQLTVTDSGNASTNISVAVSIAATIPQRMVTRMPPPVALITSTERSKIAQIAEVANAREYGLSESASGAINAAAMNEAIAASQAKDNIVYIPRGTFNVAPGIIQVPDGVTVYGCGPSAVLQLSAASNADLITCYSTANDSNAATWGGPSLRNFKIVRPSGFAAPTAGCGVRLNTLSTFGARGHFSELTIDGFFDNLRISTSGCSIIRDCVFNNFRRAGVAIDDQYQNDHGDNWVFDNWFYTPYQNSGLSGTAADQAGVRIESGSGHNVHRNKFWFSQIGVLYYLSSTIGTGSAFSTADSITGNYFDGMQTAGVVLDSVWGRNPTVGYDNARNQTNTLGITNNHFFASYAIQIQALAGAFSNVNVTGNRGRATRLLRITGAVDILNVSGNSIDGSGADKAIIVSTPSLVTNANIGNDNNFKVGFASKPDLRPDSSIWSGLVAHWKFDEATGAGVRVDSTNHGNDLTASASITAGAFMAGNGVHFAGNHLTRASNADMQLGAGGVSFSVAFWAKVTATGFQILLGKWGGGSGQEWIVYYDNGDTKFTFQISPDGGSTVAVTATAFGNVPLNTPLYVVCSYEASSHISISVNGVKNSTAHTAGVFAGTAPLYVGREFGGSPYSGWIDELSFIKGRTLRADQEQWLRNDQYGRLFDSGGMWDQ